jgi:DNA-binding FrmR family transcriptional regulator
VAGAEKRSVLNRLKRIEGQIRGIQRMLEEDKPCADVLDQIAAARTALHNAGVLIIANHARECLMERGGEGGRPAGQTMAADGGAPERVDGAADPIEELVRIMKKLARS